MVERRDRPGCGYRVVLGHEVHRGAEVDARRLAGDVGERVERRRAPAVVPDAVLAHPDGVEAELLRQLRVLTEAAVERAPEAGPGQRSTAWSRGRCRCGRSWPRPEVFRTDRMPGRTGRRSGQRRCAALGVSSSIRSSSLRRGRTTSLAGRGVRCLRHEPPRLRPPLPRDAFRAAACRTRGSLRVVVSGNYLPNV